MLGPTKARHLDRPITVSMVQPALSGPPSRPLQQTIPSSNGIRPPRSSPLSRESGFRPCYCFPAKGFFNRLGRFLRISSVQHCAK